MKIYPVIKTKFTQIVRSGNAKRTNLCPFKPKRNCSKGEGILDKFFQKLVYYSHSYVYKKAYKKAAIVKTTKIPVIKRNNNKQKVIVDLLEYRLKDSNSYAFRLKNGKKTIGETYFLYEPHCKEFIEGTNVGITFPTKLHCAFSDTLAGRKEYKNLFNILNQAMLEKGLSSGYLPIISFTPVKMSGKQRSLGMDSFQKFIGAEDGTFSRETLISKIKDLMKNKNYLFEETPQNILTVLKNEKIDLTKVI